MLIKDKMAQGSKAQTGGAMQRVEDLIMLSHYEYKYIYIYTYIGFG